jgi:hypothetical protein
VSMNTPLPGRNDPCWCGSGKKYKKCHYAEDQRNAAARASQERARQEHMEALGHPSDDEIRQLYTEATGRPVPAGPLPAEARNAITELWRERRVIAQAREQVEPHFAEWETYFAEHPTDWEQIAADLASDPFYENYELTQQNQAKVRSQLGPLPEEVEALHAYTTEAIALTLDEDDRRTFNHAILSQLQDLVDAGKWKEAYVLTTAADRVLDPEAPISPFLRDVVVRSMREATPA